MQTSPSTAAGNSHSVMRILGSRPLLVPDASQPGPVPAGIHTVHSHARWEVLVVMSTDEFQAVPVGYTLVTREHGRAPGGCSESERTWPAGTAFRLERGGDAHVLSAVNIKR